MDAKFIIAAAAVGLACFVAGLVVGSRRGGRGGQMIVQPSPLAPGPASPSSAAPRATPGSVNLQLGRDLEPLISAGQKIEAIKLVRQRTGLGLKEAKDAVERLEDLMRNKLGRRG